jgi:capsular polysaccharide biosynthesis protein
MPIRSVADLVVLFIHGYPVVMDKAGRVVPELSARLWPILPLYDKELAAMASTTHVVEEAFLASGDEQTTNFCHFTLDTLGRVGSLWSAGLGGIPLLVPEPTYAWQADYLTGVRGGGAVVSPQSSFSAIAAKKLYFTDDYGSRLLHPAYKGAPWALGYLNSLRTLLPGADAAGELPDRIFVGRGDAAQRRLDTEVEFAQALVELGFVHLHLTELAVGQQAEVFRHASVVVGVHGAGLANAAYLKPGSTLVEITGDSYNPPMFQIVAKARRVRYASIMGKNNGIDTPQADIEMEVEPAVTALRSFIDGVGGTPRTPLQAA